MICSSYVMSIGAEGELKVMMKNKKQVKKVLIGAFYGTVFVAQIIAWTIINHI